MKRQKILQILQAILNFIIILASLSLIISIFFAQDAQDAYMNFKGIIAVQCPDGWRNIGKFSCFQNETSMETDVTGTLWYILETAGIFNLCITLVGLIQGKNNVDNNAFNLSQVESNGNEYSYRRPSLVETKYVRVRQILNLVQASLNFVIILVSFGVYCLIFTQYAFDNETSTKTNIVHTLCGILATAAFVNICITLVVIKRSHGENFAYDNVVENSCYYECHSWTYLKNDVIPLISITLTVASILIIVVFAFLIFIYSYNIHNNFINNETTVELNAHYRVKRQMFDNSMLIKCPKAWIRLGRIGCIPCELYEDLTERHCIGDEVEY